MVQMNSRLLAQMKGSVKGSGLIAGGIKMIHVASATEMKNNFGRYLAFVMKGDEIIIKKNGREVGRLVPRDTAVTYLTDSLTGVLKGNYDLKQVREERLKEKYAAAD